MASINGTLWNYTNASLPTNQVSSPKPTDQNHEYDWRDMLLLMSFSIILVIGVLGNALVCLCFRSQRNGKLRKMENLVFYLAIVDLCASLINPSLYIYWQMTDNHHWHFGMVGCKILPTLAKATVSISCGMILLITLDRWKSICWPFHPEIKQMFFNIAFLGIIILSILAELPNLIYLKPKPNGTCQVQNATNPWYAYPNLIIYILRDVVFLGTFCITSIMIHNALYNKESANTLREQKNLKQAKETSIMIVTLAIVFIVLVFPRDILHISYMFSWLNPPGIPYTKTIRDVNATLKVLHMCNSVTNVFIYAGLHGRFRARVTRLFKRALCGDKSRSRGLTVASESDTTVDDVIDVDVPILIDRYTFDSCKETDLV